MSETTSEIVETKPATRQRRTQEERRHESSTKMLDAAAELFALQGYERTTFMQIGERSGYSNGLIAHRFGTKAELVNALIREIRERTSAGVAAASLMKRSVTERMNEIIRTYVNAVIHGGARLRALFVLMAESVGPLAEQRAVFADLNRAFIGLVELQINEGIKSGEFRTNDHTRDLAIELVAALRGLTLLWLIDPEGIDMEAACERKREEFIQKLIG